MSKRRSIGYAGYMQQQATTDLTGDVYFVYDGDCPICCHAAHALRIRQAVGRLHLINAREGNAPLVAEVTAQGYDLDAGMVIKFGGRYYHGADALSIMALLGTGAGWFNRMNALLFRSKRVAGLLYPAMRGSRNLLLRLKGVPQLRNLAKEGDVEGVGRLHSFKLLLPALIPSWRFFDEIAPSPRIEYRLLENVQDETQHWKEFRPRPLHLSMRGMLKRMVWNPQWNESLFLVSCAERLMEKPTDHSEQEILSRIKVELTRHAIHAQALQFRVLFIALRGEVLHQEITYVSPVYLWGSVMS